MYGSTALTVSPICIFFFFASSLYSWYTFASTLSYILNFSGFDSYWPVWSWDILIIKSIVRIILLPSASTTANPSDKSWSTLSCNSSLIRSEKLIITLSGVLISCDIWLKNSVFNLSDCSAFSFAIINSSSAFLFSVISSIEPSK